MGLFDSLWSFIRKSFYGNPESRENQMRLRWTPIDDGTYSDMARDYDPNKIAWRVGVGWFESWFQGLEQRVGQSLGRRLAHAAVEYEEHMMRFETEWHAPSGRDPASWSSTIEDWESRGLGRFELLDDDEETRVLVDRPASGPICSGLVAAAWERATGERHRFLWSESAGEGLVITLTPDDAQVPEPKPRRPTWNDQETGMPLNGLPESDELWGDLRVESSGHWSIMNERRMFLHRDLILRFEDYCVPYLDGIHEGREGDYAWEGLDDKRSAWWTAAADSARERFVAEGHHVLIRDPSDWVGVARRHLSYHGLGGIESTAGTDEHGGVCLGFTSVFHPAIASGVLLGCWERAYGRNGRASVRFENGRARLELRSSREIAA